MIPSIRKVSITKKSYASAKDHYPTSIGEAFYDLIARTGGARLCDATLRNNWEA